MSEKKSKKIKNKKMTNKAKVQKKPTRKSSSKTLKKKDQLSRDKQLTLLSSMVKQCTEGMALIDLEGDIQFTNNTFAEMHGYSPDELIGKHLTDFFNTNQLDFIEKINDQIQRTGVFIGEIWHKHRNGTAFPTHMHNSLLRDESGAPIGLISIIHDITMQKQAEEALRESETRYRQLINNAGNPIILFDLQNRVVLVNNVCAKNFGHRPKEMIGKSIQELLPDFAKEISKRNKKVVSSGIGFEVEDFIQLPAGTRWYTTNLQPAIDADGNIYGVMVISNDITESKISEDKLRKISEELKKERNALQEKNVTLKQVFSHIEDDRRESIIKIQKEMKKTVLPQIKKLSKKLGKSYKSDLASLETIIKAILAQDQDSFKANYGTLTARESEISELIKQSLSSKEISERLNISLPTVFKHREQIRKKLEITNKNIGLATFLRSHKNT